MRSRPPATFWHPSGMLPLRGSGRHRTPSPCTGGNRPRCGLNPRRPARTVDPQTHSSVGLRIITTPLAPGVSALRPQPPANCLHPLRGAQTWLHGFRNRSSTNASIFAVFAGRGSTEFRYSYRYRRSSRGGMPSVYRSPGRPSLPVARSDASSGNRRGIPVNCIPSTYSPTRLHHYLRFPPCHSTRPHCRPSHC